MSDGEHGATKPAAHVVERHVASTTNAIDDPVLAAASCERARHTSHNQHTYATSMYCATARRDWDGRATLASDRGAGGWPGTTNLQRKRFTRRSDEFLDLAPTCSHGCLKSTSCLPPHCTQTQAHVSYGNEGCHGLQAVGADLRQPGFEQRPRTAASGARARPSFEENLGQLG